MGGAVSSGENNDALVDNLIRANYIKSPDVERVFRAVDRAFYYTDDEKSLAYKDLAWKSQNLHLSAPCIYSQVMENLELKRGMSFLNLGSGTGYLSTMVGLILGSKGINHGLEIHSEVIDYATEKVHSFMNANSAMDEYEFCIPQFKKGNCLSLVSTERRYDRIYCGAGCPEMYNDYIRQLVEVGGILVMPMNDQLLQIRRLDENSWAANSVLPVSFASLVLPQADLPEDVVLPSINPHSLQELCRFEIRALLKDKIKIEHPDLWNRCRKQPKEINKRSHFRRCVVPLFANSDSDSDSVEGAAAEEPPVNEQAQLSASSSSSDEEDSPENEAVMPQAVPSVERRSGVRLAESLSDTEDGAKTKREKFDSGVSDLFESSSDRSPSSSDQSAATESSSSSSTTVDRNSASNSNPSEPSEDETTTEHSLDFDIGEDRSGRAIAGLRLFAHSMPGERDAAALVIFENHLGIDSSDEEEDGEPTDENETIDNSNVTPAENYSFFMRRHLMELPLPQMLKSFLNYNRAF